MSKTNISSSLRSGFAYQNYWGLRLCGEWLAQPEQYQWIQFETCPDEVAPAKFYLDDIVLLDKDDMYHFYQLKQRQDSSNQWTWDDFLNKSAPRGTSMLKKWASSLSTRLNKTKYACFITNGQADPEIAKYLSDGYLDLTKIKTELPDLYVRIIKELGDESKAGGILRLFQFRFDQENLSGDELEEAIRKFFYDHLNATASGVTNLYHEIDKACQASVTRPLDIDQIRKWCEFDVPKPLEESFDVPTDFEFFDETTHQTILSDLKNPEGGIKVFFGKPGVGKSVYLSKLDREIADLGLLSIKHHYHISPVDSNPQERLNTDRIIEALKAQCKTHRKELGELGNKDSHNIPIREYISAIAGATRANGKPLVIIVDGLDHALRYSDKNELVSFLKEVCVPQPGVWLIFGMQEIAKAQLPQIVLDRCPQSEWTEIKGLSKRAVSRLVASNSVGIHLPDHSEQFDNLIEKLFSITNGNPLHLRYTLQQLKNISGDSLVTDYFCNDLVPYGEGIETYYGSLWNQLTDSARTLLLTVASVNFSFTERQLVECLSVAAPVPADITNGFNHVSHLIAANSRGQLNVYHNSFDQFLKERPEMGQQLIAIKRNVKQWLEQSQYEYLKWAELRIIEHELGNSEPLLSINRQWLIDAICYPCNSEQLSRQMRLAAKVAVEKDDFGKGLEISYLHTYYLNSMDFVEEPTKLVWQESLQRNPRIFEYIDYSVLPSSMLPLVVGLADSQGNQLVVRDIIDEIVDRLDGQEYRQNTLPAATVAFLQTLPYLRSHDLGRVHRYLIGLRELHITPDLFAIYTRLLLKVGDREKVLALLQLELADDERSEILAEVARYGIEHPEVDFLSVFENRNDLQAVCMLYQALKGRTVQLPALPQYELFVDKIPDYDSQEKAKWKAIYEGGYLLSLLYGYAGERGKVEQWIKNAPDLWSARAMVALFHAGLKASDELTARTVTFESLFTELDNLEELDWPADQETIGFQFALRDAISSILEAIASFRTYLGINQKIALDEYRRIVRQPALFSVSSLINLTLRCETVRFAPDVYAIVQKTITDSLSQSVTYFSDRARDYANMCAISRLHGDTAGANAFLSKAVDNLLGYGYHKDMYFFDVIEAIRVYARAGLDETPIADWVQRMIRLTVRVTDYTDGDETNYLDSDVADLLAEIDPSLLRRYYFATADHEELYDAESLFKYVLRSLSFSNECEIALAGTALDNDSLKELKKLSTTIPGAKTALEEIESYLGPITIPIEQRTSSPEYSESQKDYSLVAPDGLLTHLATQFENSWERNNYLTGWLKYWLVAGNKTEIYATMRTLLDQYGEQVRSGELFDVLYPLAYEYDPDHAFGLICKAQANDHGWQRYWTDPSKAQIRWQFIKDKYPRRYLEFFKGSSDRNVPLARGVEYLLLFEDLTNAQRITEAAVRFAESLVADTHLPVPAWVAGHKNIAVLDVLVQRLIWPSPMVRERAATAIARLLCLKDLGPQVFDTLLAWIQCQQLETVIAIGLLPIIKAFSIAGDNNLDHININALASAIPKGSDVIDKLFDELAHLAHVANPALPAMEPAPALPESYAIPLFFTRYIKTFLAPVYFQRGEAIEQRTGHPFVRQWSHAADSMLAITGIQLDANQNHYYGRTEHDAFLLGMSTKISELYRSAFLRVLQEYHRAGRIDTDYYLDYAYATLPIDLSKWNILPDRAPQWWPKLSQVSVADKGKDALTTMSFARPIADLTKDVDGRVIVAAEGAIEPANGWSEDPMHSFALIGFGYRVVGKDMPDANEVAAHLLYQPGIVVIPSETDRPFLFLADKEHHRPANEDAIQIGDLEIYPIAAREKHLCINLWQMFRGYNRPFNLNYPLLWDTPYLIDKNGWRITDKGGEWLASYSDWLEGMRERYLRDVPLPHGQFLMLSRKYMDEMLEGTGLRLGYVLKTTYRTQKYSYSGVDKYEEAQLVNVGSIMLT